MLNDLRAYRSARISAETCGVRMTIREAPIVGSARALLRPTVWLETRARGGRRKWARRRSVLKEPVLIGRGLTNIQDDRRAIARTHGRQALAAGDFLNVAVRQGDKSLVVTKMTLIQLNRRSGATRGAANIEAKAVHTDECCLSANALRHCPALVLSAVTLIDIHGVSVVNPMIKTCVHAEMRAADFAMNRQMTASVGERGARGECKAYRC
jgi:hypothetical protein